MIIIHSRFLILRLFFSSAYRQIPDGRYVDVRKPLTFVNFRWEAETVFIVHGFNGTARDKHMRYLKDGIHFHIDFHLIFIQTVFDRWMHDAQLPNACIFEKQKSPQLGRQTCRRAGDMWITFFFLSKIFHFLFDCKFIYLFIIIFLLFSFYFILRFVFFEFCGIFFRLLIVTYHSDMTGNV